MYVLVMERWEAYLGCWVSEGSRTFQTAQEARAAGALWRGFDPLLSYSVEEVYRWPA